MESVFNLLLSLFKDLFLLLDRVSFMGTNLLQFSLGLLSIGVMLPIVLSLGKSILIGTNGVSKNVKSSKKTR